jgi:hypothetical protein
MSKIVKKIKPTISISCISTILHRESVLAVENTLKCLDVSKIYWFSDIDFPKDVNCEVVNIRIDHFNQKKSFNEAYSYLSLKVMPEVVDTDYNLIVQYDGYAVNKKAWTDQFLNFDYIGAVWVGYLVKKCAGNRSSFGSKTLYSVGNGGFCLRSKKLYSALKAMDIKYKVKDLIKYKNIDKLFDLYSFIDKFGGRSVAEDIIISQIYREQLEKEHEIVFATEKIANRFSIESNLTSPWVMKSFGFHGPKMLNYYNSVFPALLGQR